jgi:hypothetical protein
MDSFLRGKVCNTKEEKKGIESSIEGTTTTVKLM